MIQSIILAAAVCVDVFFGTIGCTVSGIQIPVRYRFLVGGTGAVFLGISLMGGAALQGLLPASLFRVFGFLLLSGMGILQIARQCLPHFLADGKQLCLHWKGLELVVNICFDETKADTDGSKAFSFREACLFSTAVSLDALFSGLGAGFAPEVIPGCILCCFLLGTFSTFAGCKVGKFCCRRRDFSWIGGVLLLFLAILRIV